MAEERHQDVAVVGGGVAGPVTANRLAQLGLRAVALEQGTAERYLCNTRCTGGTFRVCFRDVMSDENAVRQAILDGTGGFVNEKLAGAIALEGRRVVRWLRDEGVRLSETGRGRR